MIKIFRAFVNLNLCGSRFDLSFFILWIFSLSGKNPILDTRSTSHLQNYKLKFITIDFTYIRPKHILSSLCHFCLQLSWSAQNLPLSLLLVVNTSTYLPDQMTSDIIQFNCLTTDACDTLNITINQTAREEENETITTTNWTTQTRNATEVLFPFQANYFLAALYLILFIIGVSGNLLLLIINIWRRSNKHSVTQMFICSLAVSDLGLMLTCTWMNGFSSMNPNYIFGRFFCKLGNIWKSLAANTSAMILAVIAIDRWVTSGL